jgi:hypothetical protein
MQFFKTNKTLILGIFGAGLLIWAYFMFFAGGSSGPLLTSSGSSVSPVTQELLVTLGNLRTIRLDETIFGDPVFESLSDFGVVIPPEAIGRRNPFEAIGVGGSAAPAATTTPAAPVQ